jgi:hypothetical protein
VELFFQVEAEEAEKKNNKLDNGEGIHFACKVMSYARHVQIWNCCIKTNNIPICTCFIHLHIFKSYVYDELTLKKLE